MLTDLLTKLRRVIFFVILHLQEFEFNANSLYSFLPRFSTIQVTQLFSLAQHRGHYTMVPASLLNDRVREFIN